MQTVSLIIHCDYILPIAPENIVLTDHCVVVNNTQIVDLLPSKDAESRYQADEVLTLKGHALMPGFINAHGHAAMSLFRGLADDLPLMEWLNDHIWPAEGQWVSPEFVDDGTELAIAEMLRSGTTCYSDMYFFPEVAAKRAKHIGMRAQYVCPVLDFPTIWGSGPEEYIEKSLNLAIEYSEDELISIGFGPHAPYTVSDAPLENIRDLAIEHDIPVQIHLHETQFEVDEAFANSEKRPIARLAEIGLISDQLPLQCVHMTALNDDDIETLKTSQASVVHCPESNMKLASGFCPTQKLVDAGITVALGTDGAASNNDLDLLGEMRTAALVGKAVAQNASAINAHKALEMATLDGAKVLGLDDTIGSIEVGKAADLVAFDLDQLVTQPCFDVVSNIVYSANSRQVNYVWVNGACKLEQGKLINIDETTLKTKAKSWAQKIQGSDTKAG